MTRKHGETFADEWLRTDASGEDVWDAFAETGLMEWPDGELFDPRQARYHDIEDEILDQTFAAVRAAVAEAFVQTARKVLARERRLQRQGVSSANDEATAAVISASRGDGRVDSFRPHGPGTVPSRYARRAETSA